MRKLLLVVGALLLGVGPAVAQTSTTYPPSTSSSSTSTTSADEVVTIDHGALTEGETVTFRSCGFDEEPAVFMNDALVHESDELDAAGCATQVGTLVEDGDPETGLGVRMLAAVGVPMELAQSGNTPIIQIDGQRFVVKGEGDGTNVLQNIGFSPDGSERFVRHTFTVREGRDRGGALARTGATIVRWSLPGIALLGVGSLLVLAARRRSATR